MAQEPVGQRIYTEKETSAILKRASELQAQEEGTSRAGGMSLEQLQQAASELGIKPHLISRAATDVTTGITERPNSFWSAPTSLHRESVIPHRITEDSWPTVLNDMRRVSGRVGDSTMVGKSFEWISNQPDTFHVSVTPQGEQSRVTIAARYGEWAAFFYFIPLIPVFLTSVGILASRAFSGPVATLLIFGILTAVLSLGHLGFRAFANRRRKTVETLLTVLETPTEETLAESQISASEAQTVAPYRTQIETESQTAQPVAQVVNRK